MNFDSLKTEMYGNHPTGLMKMKEQMTPTPARTMTLYRALEK